MNAKRLQLRLQSLGNPVEAKFLSGFFKTGPGQYAEGDVFIGVRVPAIRKVAQEFKGLSLGEVKRLLHSPIHEERLAALVIMMLQAANADEPTRKKFCDFYLANTKYVNNWDLVDISAPHLVGAYLADKDRRRLECLVESSRLWDRRIGILSTFHFIRNGQFADTLRLAEKLRDDPEDLMHKAVGWMLREVGKRDLSALESFLIRHAAFMPRTMLRYAIEKFPETTRKKYLANRTVRQSRKTGAGPDNISGQK
jgi:3-methyladenine DNA glycosylase AlkD